MRPKLMLIDGNSILNRGFYALSKGSMLTTSTGLYTNAVFAFVNILNKHIEEFTPDYIAVAFDMKAKTIRHGMYDGYKARRKGMPDELAVQLPLVKEVLAAMDIPAIEREGYEADDIIGSLALKGEKEDCEVIVLTGDRDSFQLISDKTIVVLPSTKAGKTETKIYDKQAIIEQYGLLPEQLIDVKGLMGDSSDDIPGVPGVGEKTALELIKRYKTLEGVYDHIEEITKPKLKEALVEYKQQAFLSRELGTILRNLECCGEIDELKRKEINKAELLSVFRKLEFGSLISRMNLLPEEEKPVEPAVDLKIIYIKTLAELKKHIPSLFKIKTMALLQLIDKEDSYSSHLESLAVCEGNTVYYIETGETLAEESVAAELKDIWKNPEVLKTGHDIKEFITWLHRYGIDFNGLVFDTMIAEYLIDPLRNTYPVSNLSQKYLDRTVQSLEELQGKGKGYKSFAELKGDQLALCTAQNAKAVSDLWGIQEKVLTENNQLGLFREIELPLIHVLADMEFHGFKVDAEKLNEYGENLSRRISALEKTIYMIAGEEFNINSCR